MSEHNNVAFVDEKSLHDKALSFLSGIVLLSIVVLGIYCQSLPLPEVTGESEAAEK